MDRCVRTNRSDRRTGVSGRIFVIGGQVNKDEYW